MFDMKKKNIPKKIVNVFKKAVNRMGVKPMDWLFKILPYRPLQVAEEEWETHYSSERWEFLKEVGQLAHYSVIVGYCCYFKQPGTILDIGCGEGILQEKLRPYKYSRYVGVDISTEAIHLAPNKQDERTLFVRADASRYIPNERFNIIIFNECLYYFKDPLSVMRRYANFLEENGLLIVSMYVTERTKCIWKILEKSYTPDDEVRVTNKSGVSWIIKVFLVSRPNARDL